MNVAKIFETMDYGPAPESATEALDWIATRGGTAGPYINGTFGPLRDDLTLNNPATGQRLAGLTKCTPDEATKAVKAARAAQPKWAKQTGHQRARILYALARLVQKHSRLLAVMETLDNGKPIRESRDIDIPLVARHFYYHAGMAQLMESELPGAEALGVCGQIIPWNFPILMATWKLAPALSAGNCVVLKPAEQTPVSILFLVELIVRFAGEENKRHFFKSGWNIFDTLIVIASLVPVDESEMAFIGRLLRIFRVLRMVSIIPELRVLLNSLLKALPQLGYVMLLMFIIFYIYAAIGATLFAPINPELWGDISISLLTLFRVMTFEDWTDVMYETMEVYGLSWIYYLTFIFLTAFAFLNMVIGIVVSVIEKDRALSVLAICPKDTDKQPRCSGQSGRRARTNLCHCTRISPSETTQPSRVSML